MKFEVWTKSLQVLLLVALALGTLSPSGVQAAYASPAERGGLLQFAAGGHVLGFEPGGVYAAGSDHVLRVTFVGTPGVGFGHRQFAYHAFAHGLGQGIDRRVVDQHNADVALDLEPDFSHCGFPQRSDQRSD